MAANRGTAAVSSVKILAPAKINLGLAVVGKRPDGLHEIDTIMAMLDLCDAITLHETDLAGITISGMDDVPVESNLMAKAIRGWCERTGKPAAFHIDVEKRIPSPAGLGGGSSDAAAIIRALDALHPNSLRSHEMHDLAASIGADCPFFLGSAAARATGTGSDLESITSPAGGAVIIVPPTNVASKTATLYGALQSADCGTNRQIDDVQTALSNHETPTLTNSFTRAALEAFPGTRVACEALENVTGTSSLSGAGPAVYSLTRNTEVAETWAGDLRAILLTDYFIDTSEFIDKPPSPELLP